MTARLSRKPTRPAIIVSNHPPPSRSIGRLPFPEVGTLFGHKLSHMNEQETPGYDLPIVHVIVADDLKLRFVTATGISVGKLASLREGAQPLLLIFKTHRDRRVAFRAPEEIHVMPQPLPPVQIGHGAPKSIRAFESNRGIRLRVARKGESPAGSRGGTPRIEQEELDLAKLKIGIARHRQLRRIGSDFGVLGRKCRQRRQERERQGEELLHAAIEPVGQSSVKQPAQTEGNSAAPGADDHTIMCA